MRIAPILAPLFLSAVFLSAVFLPAPRAAAQESRPNDPLRAFLKSCERFGFSGSVLVAKGGKILLAEGYGLANREKKIRCAKDTLYEIASATKPFTAVAIFELEAAGKLSIDDPIGKHLPNVPAAFEEVTIRHLLTHTSGMPRTAPSGMGDDFAVAVAAYLKPKPARKPGVAYEYWNGGYALLAAIVERASGGTYMEWCKKRIFAPAGMGSSGFTGESFDLARVAMGYDNMAAAPRRADEHPYMGSYGWHYRGMGGLVTCVEDLYRFDRALRDDTLLGAKARAKMFTPCLDGYACGFRVSDSPKKRISHGGDVRGFHCELARYPDDDACIVVLQNRQVLPPFMIEEHLRALALGTSTRFLKPPPAADWPADKLGALRGSYAAPSGERVVVRVEDGALILGAEGPGIMRDLSPAAVGAPPPPVSPELVDTAKTIVAKLAEGDVELLRARLAPGIPPTWPDGVKTITWPARTSSLGAFSGVRLAGSASQGATSTILLALDFATGSLKLEIVFKNDRLQRFDFDAPDFLVEAYAAPSPDGRLVRYHWQGAPAPPIAIVRDSSGLPSALRFEGPGTPVVYKRLTSR